MIGRHAPFGCHLIHRHLHQTERRTRCRLVLCPVCRLPPFTPLCNSTTIHLMSTFQTGIYLCLPRLAWTISISTSERPTTNNEAFVPDAVDGLRGRPGHLTTSPSYASPPARRCRATLVSVDKLRGPSEIARLPAPRLSACVPLRLAVHLEARALFAGLSFLACSHGLLGSGPWPPAIV